MPRKKIEPFANSDFYKTNNNIDRYFGHYLDSIIGSMNGNENSYISVPYIDHKLTSIITSSNTSIHYLIGHKGIGKSTSIRNNINEERIKIIEKGKECVFLKKSFDTSYAGNKPNQVFLSSIDYHIRDKLICKYNDEKERNEAIFHFINNHKSVKQLLEEFDYYQLFEDRTFNHNKFILFKEKFKQSDPEKYMAFLLKFGVYEFNIQKIFIVLDDMESLEFDQAKKILISIHRLIDCLHEKFDQTIFSKLLISCRPETHSMLQKDKEINGWKPEGIFYKKPINLSEAFKRKMNLVISRDGKGKLRQGYVENVEKWELGLEFLYEAVDSLCGRRGNRITKLNNYDIRSALFSLVKILTSPFWYNSNVEGAFNLAVSGKSQETQAMFVRALLIDPIDDNQYDGCLLNIFQNETNSSTDLLYWYFYAYLVNKKESIPNMLSLNDFQEALFQLFPQEIASKAIAREIKNANIFYGDKIEGEKFIVKLPAIDEMRDLLVMSSVYTELMLFNTFLDARIHNEIQAILSKSSSNYKEKILFATLQFLAYCFQKETILIYSSYTKNEFSNTYDHSENFGEKLLSEYILEGIRNSIKHYYSIGSPDIETDTKHIISELESNIQFFKNIHSNNFILSKHEKSFSETDPVFIHLNQQLGNYFDINDFLIKHEIEYFDFFKKVLLINNLEQTIKIKFGNGHKFLVEENKRNIAFPMSDENKTETINLIDAIIKAAKVTPEQKELLEKIKARIQNSENANDYKEVYKNLEKIIADIKISKDNKIYSNIVVECFKLITKYFFPLP